MKIGGSKKATASAPKVDPDMVLINELYEEIERRPPAIEARKLLVQQCIAAGWEDAARDAVRQILRIAPSDEDSKAWSVTLGLDTQRGLPSKTESKSCVLPVLPVDTETAKLELLQGYDKLQRVSERLQQEVNLLRILAREHKMENSASKRLDVHWHNLDKLSAGRVSRVLQGQQLKSTRSVARRMETSPGKAVELAISDLDDFAKWLRSPSQPTAIDDDALREALVKRVRVIKTALPEEHRQHAAVAQMHTEHEILNRKYVNDETMYGDQVVDIPRSNFLVTDDGYAWDMEELAQAITSNSGVMRNPLTKQMFTTNDIRAIIQHPFGNGLRALQIEQDKLSQGVRPKTIEEMENMAQVLLADMSEDQMESRHVVDAFLAYLATLPEDEQKALEGLRVPAKDSHTGQGFDCSVFEAVKDAQGNRVCFHKTGDFLQQAAKHLKKPI